MHKQSMFDPFVFLFELTYTLMVMGLLTVKYKYPTNKSFVFVISLVQ